MAKKIVKDSHGLVKDLVNDCISRHGVAAWLDNMGYPRLADAIMDEKRFPSVKPERKRGKWIKVNGKTAINCSACYHCSWSLSFEDTVKRFNFCPYCGADMREVNE